MRRYGCYAAQLQRTTLVFWICSSRLTKFFFLAQFSPYPTQIIHRNVGIFVRIQKMWLIIVGITDFCQMASKQHSLQTPHSQSQSLWRDAFSNGHKWCHVQTEPNISPDSPAHDSVMFLIPFTINCVCFRVPICLWKTPDTLTQRRSMKVAQQRGDFPFSFSINMKTLTIQSHSHLEKKCLLFICIKHELRVSQKLLCIFHTAVILADTVVRGCSTAHVQQVCGQLRLCWWLHVMYYW